MILLCIIAGLDPYLDLFVLGSVPVAVSIPAMECLTAVAVFAFFLRDRRGQSAWTVYVAPAISALALAVVVYLVLANMEFYTAQTGAINWILPGVNLVVLAIGVPVHCGCDIGPLASTKASADTAWNRLACVSPWLSHDAL